VRQLVKDKNKATFSLAGGHITSLVTGKKIRFFEHQGVYYLKMKIKPENADASFVRPGTA